MATRVIGEESCTTPEPTESCYPGLGWIVASTTTESLEDQKRSNPLIDDAIKISIQGYPALKMSGYTGIAGSVYVEGYLINVEGRYFSIAFATQDDDMIPVLREDYDQILSTFEFTN